MAQVQAVGEGLELLAQGTVADDPDMEGRELHHKRWQGREEAIQALLRGEAADIDEDAVIGAQTEGGAQGVRGSGGGQGRGIDAARDVRHGNGRRVEVAYGVEGGLADADDAVELGHDDAAVEGFVDGRSDPVAGIADVAVDESPGVCSAGRGRRTPRI